MTVAGFQFTKMLSSKIGSSPQSSVRRTSMESGLQKQIPRFSRTLKRWQMSYLMTDEEFTLFEIWWRDTALFGTQWFDFEDPKTGAIVEGRIVNGDYNQQPYDVEWKNHEVTMEVEVWL